ncbi:MAG: DUF190 domain-containing protein [Methylobacterium sp.]|nr:DUF190 domain-containing protein [Methylobacterium sp.]
MLEQGELVRFYLTENANHGGLPLHEWLLREGKSLGMAGGTAFRAIAGYGRHGRLHEEHFFELAGELPLLVEFFAAPAAIDQLLTRLRAENLALRFIRLAAQSDVS